MADQLYTRAQVAEHNMKENGWFIINNEIYDVSRFYDDHPGGRDVLLNNIGADATENFEEIHHSMGAMKKLAELRVGSLVESERRKFISAKDVEGKNTAEKAWMVINNKVYDVTKFLDLHPGGRDVLLYNAGGDATQAFTDNGHSDIAYEMMKKYFIGDIDPNERKRFVNRKSHGTQTHQALTTTRKRAEDASLMERIKGQLFYFIIFSIFCTAAACMLR